MTYDVIGIEEVDYKSSKTGRQVHGRKLYLTFDFDAKQNAVGIGTEVAFASCDSVDNVDLGDKIELLYNKYGSIADVRVL